MNWATFIPCYAAALYAIYIIWEILEAISSVSV